MLEHLIWIHDVMPDMIYVFYSKILNYYIFILCNDRETQIVCVVHYFLCYITYFLFVCIGCITTDNHY